MSRMAPEESTEDLSDFELTQRLRAARGQEPLPDPDSLEAKLRAGADAMLEDHRNHGLDDHRIRGIDYKHIVIDDAAPIGPGSGIAFPGIVDPRAGTFEWKLPIHTAKPISYTKIAIPIEDFGCGTDLRFDNTSDNMADSNALALAAGGTTTGRLTAWTDKK